MHFNYNKTPSYHVFATAIHMTISSHNHFRIAQIIQSFHPTLHEIATTLLIADHTQATEKEQKMENRVNSESPRLICVNCR